MSSRIQSNEVELEMEKAFLKGNEDGISELPDSVLGHILSFLEMKDVIKTSVLSKRWKLVWTNVYKFVYECYIHQTMLQPEGRDKTERFIAFIENTLPRCVLNIREFSVSGFGGSRLLLDSVATQRKLNAFVKFVLGRKIEILKLDSDYLFYCVPGSLKKCSSLTELKLSGFIMCFSRPVDWPMLKSLYLKNMALDDADFQNLLLGCPVLESLVLDCVSELCTLSINSRSVKRLKMTRFQNSDGGIMVISAPFLQELDISGEYYLKNFVVEDVSSLVKATLTFTVILGDYDDIEELEGLGIRRLHNFGWIRILEALCHVDELLIGSNNLQVLPSSWLASLKFECKRLTLFSPLWESDRLIWKCDIVGLLALLDCSPKLENLVINVSSLEEYQHIPQILIEGNSSVDHQLKGYGKGNLKHLKNVKVCYTRNPLSDRAKYHLLGGVTRDVELLRYILRSSVGLERLVLCSAGAYCDKRKCDKLCCEFGYVHHLSSGFAMNFLSDKNAEWDLKKRKCSFEYSFSSFASMSFEE